MLIVLYILLTFIILILILLLTCLFIPLSYNIDAVSVQLPVQLSFSLNNCCYGLKTTWEGKKLNWHLLLFGLNISLKKPSFSNKKPYKAVKPQPNKVFSWPLILRLALDSGLGEQIWHLTEKLWHIVRPRHLMIKARIGFDEPHYTGWMMALAGILQKQNNSYSINLTGVWDEACLEGEVVISGKILPALLFWQLLKFLLKSEVRSILKQLRRQANPAHSKAA